MWESIQDWVKKDVVKKPVELPTKAELDLLKEQLKKKPTLKDTLDTPEMINWQLDHTLFILSKMEQYYILSNDRNYLSAEYLKNWDDIALKIVHENIINIGNCTNFNETSRKKYITLLENFYKITDALVPFKPFLTKEK
ncbi:MAG: hypothetical protein ACD_4C00116G0002 [uncultured bacterium (gcode 4)]|uniref:Uncharacterized protein n=1 Tax=uncultured bacterium (gcode 4) TaxID=1234023 RepID=K2FVC5_9BACT|nr:MAG: hypothetical protein ACD_4C00116G0002 [uncultured bacterium (gcode 4)]